MPMNRALITIMSSFHGALYELSGGSIGGRMFGMDVLLLTTTGAKTGERRTTPLMYLPDGDNLVIVASNGGNDTHPAWWHNLNANPQAEVQLRREKLAVQAETANDEERGRLWPKLVELYGGYQGYEDGTKRKIPVVILRPDGAGGGEAQEAAAEEQAQ